LSIIEVNAEQPSAGPPWITDRFSMGEVVVALRTRPVRGLARVAVALTAVTLLASCAGGSDGSGSGSEPSSHGAHAARPAPPAAPLREGERFVHLTMDRPYTPEAPNGGNDLYRCFVIDPSLTGQSFLTGSQFLPQNADIVHHAIFFRIGPESAEAARKLDNDSPGDGWTCFGDSGIKGNDWVAHWAPGADETLLTPGVGYPMPPGSLLIMQVHYNLLGTGGKAGGTDQSKIRLRLADGSADIAPLQTMLMLAPVELPCAPGESGALCERDAAVRDVTHRFGEEVGATAAQLNKWCNGGKPPVAGSTQSCQRPVERGGTLYAVAGHMHLLGRSIKVELNPGTPAAQTLLDIPAYDFDDQAIRPLAKPVTVKPGDVFRVTCTHDVGLRKQLPQLRSLPPRYVVWGDGTSDEMCLGLGIFSPSR